MKLQDFVNTELKYDLKAIAANEALSRQMQIRLIDLGLLNPPVDGIFGPLSTAALQRFQFLMDCNEPGYLGKITAKKLIETSKAQLPAPPPVLKVTKNTIFKSRPIPPSELSDAEQLTVSQGQQFQLLAFEPVRSHIRVTLRNDVFNASGVWYVFWEHAEVIENNTVVFPKPKPKMVRLNVPYKSQLDNWFNPTGSCNVTSVAMCLEYLGAKRRTSTGQFEDELYQYALNRGYSRHNPYDLAAIIREYQCQDKFVENGTIEDIQDWLAEGKPVIIHGYFTAFGHIVVVVGYDDEGFFVHDPYGEWFASGYRTDLSGAYLHYSYRLIRRVCMPDGNFWVHFVSK